MGLLLSFQTAFREIKLVIDNGLQIRDQFPRQGINQAFNSIILSYSLLNKQLSEMHLHFELVTQLWNPRLRLIKIDSNHLCLSSLVRV